MDANCTNQTYIPDTGKTIQNTKRREKLNDELEPPLKEMYLLTKTATSHLNQAIDLQSSHRYVIRTVFSGADYWSSLMVFLKAQL